MFARMRSGVAGLALVSTLASTGAPAAAARMDHDLFRRIFSGLLQATHKQEDIHKLLFYPAAPLLVAPAAASPQTYLDQVTARMRTLDPVHLYQAGLRVPLNPISPQAVVNVLRSPGRSMQERLTLVVVPGSRAGLLSENTAMLSPSWATNWKQSSSVIVDMTPLTKPPPVTCVARR